MECDCSVWVARGLTSSLHWPDNTCDTTATTGTWTQYEGIKCTCVNWLSSVSKEHKVKHVYDSLIYFDVCFHYKIQKFGTFDTNGSVTLPRLNRVVQVWQASTGGFPPHGWEPGQRQVGSSRQHMKVSGALHTPMSGTALTARAICLIKSSFSLSPRLFLALTLYKFFFGLYEYEWRQNKRTDSLTLPTNDHAFRNTSRDG